MNQKLLVICDGQLSEAQQATLKVLGHKDYDTKAITIAGDPIKTLHSYGITKETRPVICGSFNNSDLIDLLSHGYQIIELTGLGAYVYEFKRHRTATEAFIVLKWFYECPIKTSDERSQEDGKVKGEAKKGR